MAILLNLVKLFSAGFPPNVNATADSKVPRRADTAGIPPSVNGPNRLHLKTSALFTLLLF